MNYELAKQLKDAGFPLAEIRKKEKGNPEHLSDEMQWARKTVTLSELIEACGNKFVQIKRIDNPQDWLHDNKWVVYGRREEYLGKTPSEAVAKFWLALNKKDGGKNNL